MTCASVRPAARRGGDRRFPILFVVLALSFVVALAAAAPARAQGPISAADLTGTWAVTQIATPATAFTPAAVRSFSGTVTLAAGVATGGSLTDDLGAAFTVTGGTLTVTSGGVVGGTLTLAGGTLEVAEARLLLSRHAIVGVSTILANPGFFTMVRREPGQPFTIPADLAADWHYHELTPSNAVPPLPPAAAGDATWVKGTITFHQLPDAPNGCSEADLLLADGTVRAQRIAGNLQTFGCATLGAGGVENAVTGTDAGFVTRMITDATGTAANRDLILGVTDASAVGAPGMVLMSRVTPSPPAGFFAASDLAGPWRVYLHRVESARQESTWQTGSATFGAAGAFTGGTLEDIDATPTTLTTGSLLVSANGSVTGTLSAGATALADQYVIKGVLRATKDVITGVVTARVNARTQTFHGLLTMVREATVFDLGQNTYTVTEGGTAIITVLRMGNRAGAGTVHYDASGGTAPGGDYQAASGTLTFAAGAASAPFTVKTNANTLVDGNRSVNLVLSAPTGTGVLLGATATGVLNIVDEDKAGTVKLSLAAYPVAEAGKNVSIVIQRSGGAASGVVVQFATSDGTAEAGVDYTATSGSVTFGAGEISKTVMVPIRETAIVDGSRSFTFALAGATPPSTVIGIPGSALVTIGDNDVAGTVQFKLPTFVVDEAGGSALITVTRTGGSAGGVLVNFSTADGTATAPADYTATAGTLTFMQGNTSLTFSIPIANDTLVEGDETVLLTLGNPLGGAGLGAQKIAVLTIKDGQKGVQFSAPTYTATESAASATITVSRTGPMPDTATVRYSTGDGTARAGVNYKPTAGTLTFGPNVAKATFTIPLLPDKQVKGAQTVVLLLSNPTSTSLGPLSSAVLTLGDVDIAGTIKLAAATFSANEATTSAVITVSRTGGTAGGVTVDFATADQPCGSPPCPGKAQAGFDYQAVSGTLTFGPTETTKTLLVPITNDTQVNGNRAFLFNLAGAGGGGTLGTPVSALVTIVDDDRGGVIQFGAATFTGNEPATVTPTATVPITITRTGTNLAGGATAVFSTANGTALAGTDYTATATTVVFAQGETSKTVAVPILFDGVEDGNKTVLLSLASPGGGATLGTPAAAVLTMVDSTPSTRLSAASYSVNEGGTVAIPVLRGGPTNGTVKVGYAASDDTAAAGADYKATSGVLTFNPGVGALTFSVPTFKTPADDGSRTFNVNLTTVLGGPPVVAPSSAVVTIADVDPPGAFQFSAATYSATEGGAAPVVTVTRTGGAGGTVVINWTVNEAASTTTSPPGAGADYGPATSGSLTFGPGVSSLKLPLTVVNDTIAEDPETVVIGLAIGSAPVGATLGAPTTATLTILDNDNGGTLQFAAAAQTVGENVAGGKTNLNVTRTGTALASMVLVDYAATGDTTAVTLPSGSTSGTLTFGAGQTSVPLVVTILTNPTAEPDRNITVTLSNARSVGPATGLNAPTISLSGGITALKVVDDEPRLQFSAAASAVTEGGVATITVTRSGSPSGQVTVDYATGGGTAVPAVHYTPASGTLTFPTGMLSRTFTVTTFDDGVVAGSRTVGLTLSAPLSASLGATNPATLTIQDKESAGTFQFAAPTGTVVEGLPGDPGRTLRVTVTRSGANLVGPVTIGWSRTDGTATPVTDFSPAAGTLTFAAGVTSQTFDITAVDDGVAEGTETIVLTLAPPSAGALGPPSATSMTIFIVDAQQSVTFSSASFSVGETTPQAVITVLRVGVPTGPVTVTATTVPAPVDPTLQAIPGTDFQTVSIPLTFGPGEIVKTFNVPIVTSSALIRNGNRVVGLQLVDPPLNAALVGVNASALTILDFRPDLVVASVASPVSGIAGKSLPTPTTIKNLGQVASPAFRVGIFMAKDTGTPGDELPGSGSLMVQRDVPSLAAGATTALPTQLAIADDLPAGNYFVSAVANFNQAVTEADATNNGLSSAPSVLKVSSNLSKFQSASASFSLGNTGSSLTLPGRAIAVPLANPCDVAGSVNLSGSFTITSQQQDTAIGIADLAGVLNGGPLSGQPVRFVIAFTGTADASNNITASLTSIVVTGAFSATGGPPTTAPGTFTGTLSGTALSGNATGTLHTSGGGDCAFSGPLTAAAQTTFAFKLATRVPAGSFDFLSSPSIFPPVFPVGYAATFRALFDSNFPDPSAVRFTGPTGSGLAGTPSDPNASGGDDTGSNFTYRSPFRSGIAPGGAWSVLYKGLSRIFSVPTFDANRSFVLIVPTVSLNTNQNLTGVTWYYADSSGNRLNGPPSFLGGLRLSIQMNGGGDSQPQSPDLPPTATGFSFTQAGISPPEWSQVTAVVFQYKDLLGNEYELVYEKTFGVQVHTRLENVYQGSQPTGLKERLINVAVQVPIGSVDTTPCDEQVSGGFFASVRNQSQVPRVIPYDASACLDYTSSTIFPDGTRLIDTFSRRDNLDTLALPTLPPGAVFQFDVTVDNPVGLPPQTVVTSLMNAEASPATDYINIPNPATPTKKPTGFRLTDAKLGQNLTVSWTRPAYEVGGVQITSNLIVDPPSGQGPLQPPAFTLPAITCAQPSIELPTDATSATFKFPATCLGATVTRAQFCVFITGTSDADNKTSAACWLFQ